jgi:predicted nicotinamide N-methyase
MELVPWSYRGSDRVQTEQKFSFRSSLNNTLISVEVEQRSGQACHSGGVWDAAVVLCDFVCSRQWLESCSIMDIGSGTGLLAIVLSKLGDFQLCASDLEEALPVLRKNVERNHANVKVKELLWGAELTEQYDFIFLADCVFGEFDLQSLLRTLRSARKGTRLIFGYKPRLIGKEQAFFRRLGGTTTRFVTPTAYLSTNVQIFEVVV